MYNFSVIIPHKNRQQMLQRCLNSIPRRDDVQIIVVDDKSDPKQVDFSTFPGLNDKHVEVYFTKKGKGAGYARNVGLKHAKGKWLIFADSDDWYLDNLSEMMDKYVDYESDMIVFRQKRVDVNGKKKTSGYDELFDEVLRTGNYEPIRYRYACTLGRFIKRDFIEQNHIKFQEVKYSNDVMFSIKVGYYAKNLQVIDKPIYCVFESENSLMRNNHNWKNYYVRMKVVFEEIIYLKSIKSKYDLSHQILDYYHNLILTNKIVALILFPKICWTIGFKRVMFFLKKNLKKDYPKYFNK